MHVNFNLSVILLIYMFGKNVIRSGQLKSAIRVYQNCKVRH